MRAHSSGVVPTPIRASRRIFLALAFGVAASVANTPAHAQQAGNVITIPRGQSELVVTSANVQRLSIGDPAVADAVVVTAREVLVNSKGLGTTTLIIWDVTGTRRTYTVEVTIDAGQLERSLRALFPGENVRATAAGSAVVLSGTVTNSGVARRIVEWATQSGATVIDNLNAPAAQQILLKVRFAEVNRRAALDLGVDLFTANPDQVEGIDQSAAQSLSDGLVQIFLAGGNAQFEAVIRALKTKGAFRSLAEPNLLALDGVEASFLAGGEFPVPVPQAGGQGGNVITILFKEFGVRLRFTPFTTPSGRIRLKIAPEVSQLDFSTALRISGFDVPSFITRRAETEVELLPGQTLAIAGLIDNRMQRNASKIPILGDIPILGALFQSRSYRDERTELLVLVTPELVRPTDGPIPVPTGEPPVWNQFRDVTKPLKGSDPLVTPTQTESAVTPAQPVVQPAAAGDTSRISWAPRN